MSTYSAAMTAPARTLSIRATLTLATGYVFSLTGDDILSYNLTEGASGGDMLLGSALSAHGSLTLLSPDGAWQSGGSRLGNRTLLGADVHIEIGVLSGNDVLYAPAGSFIVSRVEAAEGENAVTLSGYDALLHTFALTFIDQLTYPCTLQSILQHIAAQAGCSINGTPLCNADTLIPQRPDWGDGCTLRQALAWVCGAMGCFARLTRDDRIALVPLSHTSDRPLAASDLQALTLEDTCFSFNRLRVIPRGRHSGAFEEIALDDTLSAGDDNTLTIDDNPLFHADSAALQPLMQQLCQSLSGFSFTPFSLTFCGDPTLEIGDFLTITDLKGISHPALLFSQQLLFQGALSAHLSCEMSNGGVHLPRIITSSGKLSTNALTDGIIAARHIAAGAVDAEKISARSITADKIALGAITSESGVIGSLSADSITAGKLSTDRLIVGGSEFSIVRALNQLANSLSQNNNRIEGSVLSDKSVDASKVTDDFGAGLELSSNAAVLVLAGKLDGSHSHMELTEDAINMVGGEINIATNDLQIRGMDDGNEIMSLDPEGLAAKRVVVTESFSAPNIILAHPSATAAWRGSVQASVDALPRYLTQDTTLTIPAGTYLEDIEISGFMGRTLEIAFDPGVKIIGTIHVHSCSGIALTAAARGDVSIYPDSSVNYPVYIRYCPHVHLKNLQISGYRNRTSASSGTGTGLLITECNSVVEGCSIEYTHANAVTFQRGTFFCLNCIGGYTDGDYTTNANLGRSILAYRGAHGYVEGTCPASANGLANTSGTLLGAASATPTPGGMEYVAPSYVTKTFSISKHCTYLYGERRIRDDQATTFSQGRYGEYTGGVNGWRTGAMWFADAASALSGKTVKSASLTLRRASGGWSNAVPIYLGSVALAESAFTSTLTPSFTAAAVYPIGSLKRETEATYDVTNLIPAIQAGQAIGVFEPRSEYAGEFSPAYTQIYGKGSEYEPVLTVEYK